MRLYGKVTSVETLAGSGHIALLEFVRMALPNGLTGFQKDREKFTERNIVGGGRKKRSFMRTTWGKSA